MSSNGAIYRKCRAVALWERSRALLADERGAVAFEMLFVFAFILLGLLFPAADLAIASFQYISAWDALRAFGQYVQYNPPPDVTSTGSWASGLNKTVGAYTISNVQVLCGDTSAGAACTAATVATSPVKYYAYTTTLTLAPMVLKSMLCASTNANPCSYTLPYSERF